MRGSQIKCVGWSAELESGVFTSGHKSTVNSETGKWLGLCAQRKGEGREHGLPTEC